MTLRLTVTYQTREIIITGALQWREIFRCMYFVGEWNVLY